MEVRRWGCWKELWILLHLTASVAGLAGRCSLFGRHHVHTFDGVLYAFPGDCSYLLAGDCRHRSFALLGDFVGGERSGVTLFLSDSFELHLSTDGRLLHGEKRLSLPYASHSVFAGSELGFYKLWSDEFGFSVTIDRAANIAVEMNKHLDNVTCGLCGNFNSVAADDFMAQEGFLTEDSDDFANSWAVRGVDQSCRRVTPPSQTCNRTEETSAVLSSCSLLRTSSVFLHCAHVVSPEAFLALCEEEACHCPEGEGPDCHCPILLEYARTCHAHGILLKGWLKESQCSPRCPIGMQYSECSRSCSTTCQNLNIQEVCREDCVDGCTCPVGKVLDGDRCVEVSQCSCLHMGRSFPPGSSVSQDCNTCVCRHGSWECSNEGCPGECLVMGQSHFKSFDNKFFTLTGQCQYLLARDCTDGQFSVIIENIQCGNDQDAVCTRSVTLTLPPLEDMTVKLKHGGLVSVNGMDIQLPMHHGRLHFQRSAQSSVRVKYGEDLSLDWDGRGRVLLKLGPIWAGQTCGLCGNYNGNQGDDFLSGAGLVEAGPQAFGQSWMINGDCDTPHRVETDPCALNPKRVGFAEEACSAIMSEVFSPCHFLVNPTPFQRFCRYDVCACADGEECLCGALADYAAACSARGVLLNWRSPSLCELQCQDGQVYQACGSTCDQTCRSLSGAEGGCRGERRCEEGCFCPPGQFLSDSGDCVGAEDCPCLHDGQLYQPSDVYADHQSVCTCESGVMHCSSSEMNARTLSDLFYDDEDDLAPSRERRSTPCTPPLVRTDCEAGQKGLECARTCQNLDLPCVSQACIPGCLCPAGMVRHLRDCIAPEQCPCFHNNRPYAAGQTIAMDCKTCVCENRKWRCTEEVCDGVCRTVGEGHYVTFDGFKYSFPGPCQYVLAQDMCDGADGSFRILVENGACGIVGHRCAKAVTVFYHGGLITMQHGEVKMIKPVLQGTQVEIIHSGQFYTLLLGKHLSLSWDQGHHLLLHISTQYRGRVCGLCGNYDGNINNDLMSSNNQLEVDSAHFGNSWKVKPSCADAVQLSSPCSDNLVKLVTVEQSCRVLTSPLFTECNSQVDAEPYVEMCVDEACSCPSVGDCACFCDVIAAYAHACSEVGVHISWRSNQLCPLSCEDLNSRGQNGELLCQWRYNICASACPVTCQHPDPLACPLKCVEGCHAYCPPDQLLDEVTMQCVHPSECKVCMAEGQRISHGNKVILNHDNPQNCKVCHCENNTLSCEACSLGVTTPTPTPPSTTPTSLPFSTLMPEGNCDRAMDLAFLLDASLALSEEEFEAMKQFILGVVERFRMGSAHTRATVLPFHSGVKRCELQVQKWLFKKIVRDLHYVGGNAAFLDEAVKYLAINIYDKNKREHAGRVAVILTASANPRPIRTVVKMLRKKDITTLTVALGPGVNMAHINEINKVNPDNRAYILSSTAELPDRLLEVTDYLCTLGLEPEGPKVPPTKPAEIKPDRGTSNWGKPKNTVPVPSTAALTRASVQPVTTPPPSLPPAADVTIILEGSDKVGPAEFNKSLRFVEEVITKLSERQETIRITVIQYSATVTVEIRRWQLQYQRQQLIQRLRQISWRGGAQTNTGAALNTTYEQTSTGATPPQLVFLVIPNPPTDTVQHPQTPNHTHTHLHFCPIFVGSKVNRSMFPPLNCPQQPVTVSTYDDLPHEWVTHTILSFITLLATLPPLTTLPPLATLPPPVPCKTPMDVIFLLKAGEQFEDMKTFVKNFINQGDIGQNSTHVSVVQYGGRSRLEISWQEQQSKSNLLTLLDRTHSQPSAAPAMGSALRFAVQSAISLGGGARPGVPKAVIMLVTHRSTDDVQKPADEAQAAGISVFPIGVGPSYDRNELRVLGRHGNQDNSLHLISTDQLLMLLTLDRSYLEKICRAGPPGVCVDDSGIERSPGESWLLPDSCHMLLCHPNGVITVQSHKVSCSQLEPPACRSNLQPVKVQGKCACHWECPCMCTGTSTNHVVRFDGMALRLGGEGLCSYTLLTVAGSNAAGLEVTLHNGPCQGLTGGNQVCMKAMEVNHGSHKVLLKDDMTAEINDRTPSLPWRGGGLEVVRYGGVMLQLKSELGYVMTFAPQNNEFTIKPLSSASSPSTTGLCGACGEDHVNDLSLRNGSSTPDQQAFISDWTVAREGGVCVPKPKEVCVSGAALGCQALRSEVFQPCHAHVPIQVFLSMCEERACVEQDVCELVAQYAQLCRQSGVCVDWRTPHLCSSTCLSPMVYQACRTGCIEDCFSIQTLPGDSMVPKGNESLCMDSPREGCFCPEGTVLHRGECVSPDECNQCVDRRGRKYQYMQSWVPEENPCLICMCLDNSHINCTARPCNDAKPPLCGPCEVPREKRGSRCCPEYECVCDLTNCKVPDAPRCEDGQMVVLKNPGQCQPVHQCECKKENCEARAQPPCPAHRKLSIKRTQCCDAYECECNCQNSTHSCPPGFITSSSTNDCGCTETTCLPDKVCVVGGVVYPVGSEWEESCQKCSCSHVLDQHTNLHQAQCAPPVCDRACPLGSLYAPGAGGCCGSCRRTGCLEEVVQLGDSLGPTLRHVGEKWVTGEDRCLLNECVKVNEEVFISTSNVSCPVMDTPACPLGAELRCDTVDCCPRCRCAPLDACVLNHTVIGVGERLMVDVCTHCECSAERGAVRKYRLECRRIRCPTCPEGYTLQREPDACCGRCVPTACILPRPDGQIISLQVNTTQTEGCITHRCGVNSEGGLVLRTTQTACPAFDRQSCLDHGGKVGQLGTSCCEMCTEPECRRAVGELKSIQVGDCRSEEQIELHYCEGRCSSKSMYSLQRAILEQECGCCSAVNTEPLSVPIVCANGTRSQHTVLSVTACDCLSKNCT